MSEINLNPVGDDEEGKDAPPDEGKRKRRTRREKPERERKTRRKPTINDRDLQARLEAVFERIAAARDMQGDAELAGIVREDAEVMAAGLVTLTRPFVLMRTVVLAFVSVVEPVLAFRRVLIKVAQRWVIRRGMAHAEEPAPDDVPPDAPPYAA